MSANETVTGNRFAKQLASERAATGVRRRAARTPTCSPATCGTTPARRLDESVDLGAVADREAHRGRERRSCGSRGRRGRSRSTRGACPTCRSSAPSSTIECSICEPVDRHVRADRRVGADVGVREAGARADDRGPADERVVERAVGWTLHRALELARRVRARGRRRRAAPRACGGCPRAAGPGRRGRAGSRRSSWTRTWPPCSRMPASGSAACRGRVEQQRRRRARLSR